MALNYKILRAGNASELETIVNQFLKDAFEGVCFGVRNEVPGEKWEVIGGPIAVDTIWHQAVRFVSMVNSRSLNPRDV